MPVNTAALKSFAPAMRRQLIEAVGRKLDLLLTSQTPDTLSTYAKQIAELREQAAQSREQLLEQVAYSWFNRLAALRYLDAKGWHPFGCRVLMPAGGGETQPELLKLMRSGSLPLELKEHTNENRLNGLLDGQIPTAIAGADPQGEVYRELVLAVCHSYHQLLPNLFEGLDDATELLLPDDLLSDSSIVGAFRKEIYDDDCQDVESLGWLYQFYIAEKKDEVMARKKAVPTEDIPAVTQLFTPHWIVRYLVENSLGRLWLLNRPSSGIKAQMPYYIEGEAETDFLKINKPEEIRLVDPAVGSGHMLTYAFDLLTLIYEEEGYAPTEIPALILRHNLHGLEICPRAAQLAELALVFKAREKSRRFFQPEHLVRPRIIELRDVRFAENELRDYIRALGLGDLFNQPMLRLLHQFEEAKNFGSLIQPCLDEKAIADVRRTIEAKDLDGQLFLRETHLKVLRVLEQAEALTQRYHVIVANPPYMGGRYMEKTLKTWAEEIYPNSKVDTYSLFIERSESLSVDKGYFGLITMQSWMFLCSFANLRSELFERSSLVSMLHTGPGVFPDLGAFNVLTTAFVFCNAAPRRNQKALFIKANEGPDIKRKQDAIADSRYHMRITIDALRKVPDFPLVYWLSENAIQNFSRLPSLGDICPPKQGMATGDNGRFVRLWHEVEANRIGFGIKNINEALTSQRSWFPYNKGGNYRKWYGNNTHLLRFDSASYAVLKTLGNHCPSEKLYFKEGIVYSLFGFENFGVRYKEHGFVFDVSGSSIFPNQDLKVVLAFLCSNVAFFYLKALAPTVNFQVGDLARLPLPKLENLEIKNEVIRLASANIELCKGDWDAWETSWGFTTQRLLNQSGNSLQSAWESAEREHEKRRDQLSKNEESINSILISEYHLVDEVEATVIERDLSIKPLSQFDAVTAFLSYAVGCMMGRYSLDHPGLILANGGDSLLEFLEKVGKPLAELSFAPDPDGIIPVLDGEWFEDDIVARSREFIAVTFPESSVVDNLRFIEDSLGKDIRKYFCTDFYKDHLQTYKKRPIYWLLQSPKKGFSCLIYLHRYTKDTLNLVLNNYFRPYLQKLEARQAQLGLDQLNDDLPTRERTAARKEAEKITKVLKECQAWEQDALLPLAQQRIELELDDGVKVNYLKLQDVLAPIPGLAAKEE